MDREKMRQEITYRFDLLKQLLKFLAGTAITIFFILAAFIFLMFHTSKKHIKTEYGDSFTLYYEPGFPDDTCWIADDNSDFVYYFDEDSTVYKSDFKAVNDARYYRCYQIKNDRHVPVNVYIVKKTEDGSFYSIDYSENDY